jgi:hypothetical protein
LKICKSPGIHQIPAELIRAGGVTKWPEIHKRINSIWNKEEVPEQWKEYISVHIYKKGDNTDCTIIKEYHCYQLHTKRYPTLFCQG